MQDQIKKNDPGVKGSRPQRIPYIKLDDDNMLGELTVTANKYICG